MKIYLAHPISMSKLSPEEMFSYQENMIKKLGVKYEILAPMLGEEFLRTDKVFNPEENNFSSPTPHAIKERDQWMVRQSDLVFADFTGIKGVSIGMCMELAWADILGKHTIVVLDKDNFHKHPFVMECADILFETAEQAINYLLKIGE